MSKSKKSGSSKKATTKKAAAEAVRPFYAYVGAADLALTMARDAAGDLGKRLASAGDDVTTLVDELQKNVSSVKSEKPADLAAAVIALVNERFEAMANDAKTRQEAIESLLANVAKEYKTYPKLAQTMLSDGAESAAKGYEDLAERGESVVERLRKTDSAAFNETVTNLFTKVTENAKSDFADVVDDVRTAASDMAKKATPKKKAEKKDEAKRDEAKAPAKKAAATKAPAAKKAPATKAPAKKAPAKKAPAAKPAAKKAPAVKPAAKKAPAAKPAAKRAPAATPAAPPAEAAVTPAAPAAPAAAKPAAAPAAKPATPAAGTKPTSTD